MKDEFYLSIKYLKPLLLIVVAAFVVMVGLLTGAQTAFAQGPDTCMGDEGFETNPATNKTYVQGMQDAADLNCTANDVVVAETQLISGPVTCMEGDKISVEITADLESNSNARRSDIGIWIANDGGDAITGSCTQFYFVDPALEELDDVADGCRDIGAQQLFQDVPLDTPQATLDVVCRDDDGNGFLDVGSCIGWKVPGDDQICPDDADGNGTSGESNDFIKGTLPANKAKCRCSNIEIPITVLKVAYIEVIKDLIPSNDTGLFTLQIDGAPTGTSSNVGDNGTTGKTEVSAGTNQDPGATHTVGESAGTDTDLNDYITSIECVDRGTDNVVASTSGSGPLDVDVEPDDDIVCTITNERKPELKLVKSVTNDNGGTAGADSWTLSATAASPDDGLNFSNAGGSGSFQIVYANVDYVLAESGGPSGYTAGPWSCDGGSLVDSTVTLQAGDQVTCTITNDDIAPTLTLVKTVTNDDGGDALASAWTLTASGDGGFSGTGSQDGVENKATNGPNDVKANVNYSLSESGPSGYSASDWSCSVNGGSAVTGSSITLALADSAVCTINNDDNAPTLKLVKTVTNDNGGTAVPNDWDLTATGNGGFTETTPDTNNATAREVIAGVGYDLSESGPSGYTAGSWSCDGGTLVGSTITLGLDDDVTCTINNDDNAPTLKLGKTVTNDDGGTAVPNDWDLTATGNGGFTETTPDTNNATAREVIAGVGYDLSESGPSGYTAGSWSCDGGTLVGSTITLGLDDDVTCTINNDDNAPTLKLVKVVDNGANPGGTKEADDWTLSAARSAGEGDDSRDFSNDGGSGVFETVFANTDYDLSESDVAGYQLKTDWSCDGGTQAGSTITLALGEDVTCTIENEALAMVNVLKTVSGAATAGFTFEIRTGASETQAGEVVDGATCTTDANGECDFGGAFFVPGDYQFCETGMMPGWMNDLDGFTPAGAVPEGGDNSTECVNFTLDPGETEVFTIDNTPPPGGDARTIGFWKNWTSCDGKGNQAPILDQTLAKAEPNGITIGNLTLHGSTSTPNDAPDCGNAVSILDKRDIQNGKKMANDGAYNLAAQLLAAKLNVVAEAGTCQAATDAITAGDALLVSINFTGKGSYLRPKDAKYAQALALAATLDAYNNNLLCSP